MKDKITIIKRVYDHSSSSKLIAYTISKHCARLYTFVVDSILNFTKLLFRSLILRSFTCVFFYLVFGIDTAPAWVDYAGNNHPPDHPKVLFPGCNMVFNRVTGETIFGVEEYIAANGPREFEEYQAALMHDRVMKFEERRAAAFGPTEHPSNNSTAIPAQEEGKSNNPTAIPVQEEGKSNNADAKRNNLANMLSGSSADANIDRYTIVADDSVTQIGENSTQALEGRLKELHDGSAANSYINNKRDVPQPVLNNPLVYSLSDIPPVPTNIPPPVNNDVPPTTT